MKNSDIRNRDFDLLLSLGASEQAQKIASDISEEAIDNIETSAHFQNNMQTMFTNCNKASKAKEKIKVIRRVAACIAFVLCLGLVATLSVEASRKGLWDFITQYFEKYMSFSADANDEQIEAADINYAIKTQYNDIYLPEWLPEGFVLQQYDIQPRIQTLVYNKDGRIIKFTQTETSMGLTADYELDDYTITVISGNNYYILEKKNDDFSSCMIVWRSNNRNFSMVSSISKNEILRIVQSVEYYK